MYGKVSRDKFQRLDFFVFYSGSIIVSADDSNFLTLFYRDYRSAPKKLF